ncbi:MAG: hypothetical protein ACJ8EL_00170 [Rhizomicrobium sp.]
MIISYAHNFIYFRPKKTGSSTIVDVLRPSLGENDISRVRSRGDSEGLNRLHMKAEDVKNLVPPEFWRRSYKFASERHPYEKAVSLAFFRLAKQQQRRSKNDEAPMEDFLALLGRVVDGGEYRGFKYYTIGGTPVVDEFIRHESLERDLRHVAARLGLAVPDELPRSKGSFRLDPRPAREILSEEQRNTIFQKCLREFELLGYEP